MAIYKYEIGTIIWYLVDSKVCSSAVHGRIHIEAPKNPIAQSCVRGSGLEEFLEAQGGGAFYMTRNGLISEKNAAGSKAELVNLLMGGTWEQVDAKNDGDSPF